jgi:hypothetical protein
MLRNSSRKCITSNRNNCQLRHVSIHDQPNNGGRNCFIKNKTHINNSKQLR